MVQGTARLGHDATSAILSAGINPAAVNIASARITSAQMERISGQLMREVDDEALGWFSRRLPWGSYGMLARASISSPTLGVAIARWCRHHALLTKDIELLPNSFHSSDSEEATVALIEGQAGEWLSGDLRVFCHVSMLRNLLGLASWLVDSRITPVGVRFGFPEPAYSDVFSLLFGGACVFDHPQTELMLDRRYLELPLLRNDAELRQLLKRALPLTVHSYRKDRLLVGRIKHALTTQPATSRNANALATALNMSVRTLHRHLREEGETLQSIKDDIRRARATDLLIKTDQPTKSIAANIGMDSEKSFLRAFKRWTGETPRDFRQRFRRTTGGQKPAADIN